ncbi:transposase [Aliivibrio fischeri]|nr:transposase [Aliivibrio fischeri]
MECKRQGVVPRTLTEELILTAKELICRLIEQIPDKHFKMIRYYGFYRIDVEAKPYRKCMMR